MMVFRRELGTRWRGLFFWSVSIILLMWTSLVKFGTITADTTATTTLLNTMPATIKTIFGMNNLDATSLGGYIGICFLFAMILLAIHAGLLGASLVTIEPQTKTTEFLYTKPIGRLRVLLAKLSVGLIHLVVLWLITYAATWLSIVLYASMKHFSDTLLLFMLAAGIVQLTVFALGFFAAAAGRSTATAARTVALFVCVSYILSLVSQFNTYSWLHYFSIFSYFNAADILHDAHLKLHYVLLCLGLSLFFVAASCVVFRRRDLLPS